jgi:hypothetical protein
MAEMARPLPPCGLYRTSVDVAGVPAGRLVYFHNHGNPGPGIYPPSGWKANRAQFSPSGRTLDDPESAHTLEPLPAEGLYRVLERFHCCERHCREFTPELLVQLGYDGEANPILFVPEWLPEGLALPERGVRVDGDRLDKLAKLVVAARPVMQDSSSTIIH